MDHALNITKDFENCLKLYFPLPSEPTPPRPDPRAYVYYLMVGPNTVKIGTTTQLQERIRQLRTELQYVVAIERGGRDVERQRHLEYATERIGRKEDFIVSERLQAHIEKLAENRGPMMKEALTRRKVHVRS